MWRRLCEASFVHLELTIAKLLSYLIFVAHSRSRRMLDSGGEMVDQMEARRLAGKD